jgi:hypothetical protein
MSGDRDQKQFTLTVYGRGIALEWGEIDRATADSLIEAGIQRDDLETLLTNREAGITSDIQVSVDGEDADFEAPADIEHTQLDARALKMRVGVKTIVLLSEGQKGEFGAAELPGRFDPSKLEFSVARVTLGDMAYGYYDILYDGEPVDFGETRINVFDCYVVEPDGAAHAFDIHDGEWDAD